MVINLAITFECFPRCVGVAAELAALYKYRFTKDGTKHTRCSNRNQHCVCEIENYSTSNTSLFGITLKLYNHYLN